MTAADEGAPIDFGDYRLEPANARLARGAQALDLPPKAFSLLCHLAARPGQLVTKDELLDAVWGRRFVSESVLKTAVNTVRSVLGDDPKTPRYVETVPRRGYRFVAAVRAVPAAAPAPVPGPAVASVPMPVPPPRPAADDAAMPWLARGSAETALDQALAAVLAGSSRPLVLVGGEAGIGKTTLIDRFCRRVPAACWLASGQCVEPFGGGEPLLPVLDALAALTRGPQGAAWVQALRLCAPAWLARLPWLQGDAAPAAAAGGSGEPERMLREFGVLLDAVTAERPLVLVLEDLHWSDHATIQLLGYLARRRGVARWLVVASFRPTDAALAEHPVQALRLELRAQRLCTELTLDAFTESEVDAYLARRFAPAEVVARAELARALHHHTEGLPLFVAALVDDLLQGGALATTSAEAGSPPAWALAPGAWQALQVPETIAGLIERQIARLPGALRALLEAAAVLGTEFAHDVLAALLAEPADALRTRCDGLARRGEWLASAGMVERPDGGLAFRYAFRHALYQRVFYERAEPAQRLQHHLAAAQALLAVAGHADDRHAAELAQHFERARDTAAAAGAAASTLAAQARRWRLAAARAARALHAPADALAHYARLLEGELPAAEEAVARMERAELLRRTGRGEAARAESAQAIERARAAGDASLVQDARLVHAGVEVRCDRTPEGLAAAEALLRELPADDPRAVEARLVQAEALHHLGRLEEADAALQAAMADTGPDDVARRAAILGERVGIQFQRGALADGLTLATEAQAAFERCGDPVGAARMLTRVGTFAQALERRAEAEAALTDARERLHRLHHVDGERGAILNLAKLYSDEGDAERALGVLEAGWRLAEGFESPVAECAFLTGFYYCHYLRGDLGTAFADAERVVAAAGALNALYWRIGPCIGVSDLYLHLGELDTAAALLEHAVQLSREGGVKALFARATLRLGWLRLAGGDAAGALAAVDSASSQGPVEHLEDLAGLDRVRAQAQFALGDAAGALATLAGHDGAPTLEVWALMLALRLDAGRALGTDTAPDVKRALAVVGDRRLPALEGLVLQRSLVHALRVLARAAEAQAHAQRHAQRLEAVAHSLAGQPARAQALLQRFAL